MLVSKAFAKPEELAATFFLKKAIKVDHQFHLSKMALEVQAAVLQHIQRINLCRLFANEEDVFFGNPQTVYDSFERFKNVATILKSLPNLQRIDITFNWFCTPIARFEGHGGLALEDRDYREAIKYVVGRANNTECILPTNPAFQTPLNDNISYVAEGFIADCESYASQSLWRFPHPRSSDLVHYIEGLGADVEIVFHVKICITSHSSPCESYCTTTDRSDLKFCWARREMWSSCRKRARHVKGQISTRDWILRFQYDGEEHAVSQKLVYDLAHSSAGGSDYFQITGMSEDL